MPLAGGGALASVIAGTERPSPPRQPGRAPSTPSATREVADWTLDLRARTT